MPQSDATAESGGTPIRARAGVLVFALLFCPYVYFNHSEGWNQGARVAELHAVGLHASLAIDAYHEITGDKALIDGHYYSEKAPAIALLALPAFETTVRVQQLIGIDPDAQPGWRVSEWVATAGSVGILAACCGVAFFALVSSQVGKPIALLATVGVFLGSLTFPYATALFAHAGTVGLLTMALWSVLDRTPSSRRRDYFGGLCAGAAIASEYPAILAIGTLVCYLAWTDRQRVRRFGVALLPGLGLILLNNYLITGSPLVLGYGTNAAFPEVTAANYFGFRLPSRDAAVTLLWSEYRGLLFWNPVLLMALPGVISLWRSHRAQALMVVAAASLTVLQVASFSGWPGGNAVGPRYLSPAIPLLGLAAAHGIKWLPKTGAALTTVSVLLMAMVAAVAIDPPQDVLHPLRDFYLVRIQQGRFATNLGTLAGLSPVASLLVLLAILLPIAWLLVRDARATMTDAAP